MTGLDLERLTRKIKRIIKKENLKKGSKFVVNFINKKYLVTVISIFMCNQIVYDKLYREILLTAISTMNLAQKHRDVDTLRALCNGQKSSYEQRNENGKH